MKTVKKSVSLLVLSSLVFTAACSSKTDGPDSGKDTKPVNLGKYEEPVTMNIGYVMNQDSKWPSGSNDSFTDNRYTRWFEENLNIKFNYAFQIPGGGYDQKVNLLISGNDIPDFMRVNEAQFKLLAESDMLEDLTNVYESYASPLLKEVIGGFGNQLTNRVSSNGKLLGIPSTIPAHDSDPVVWIRKDWLDKVGINLPLGITIDDVEKVAKAFIEQDPDQNGVKDTYGIMSTSNFVTNSTGNNSLDAYFTSLRAYPKFWTKDKNGDIVYGSTTSETKQALGKLREWYAAGLIDKEFGTIKPDQFAKGNSAGKAGISTGATWSPMSALADSVKNDPKAEWKAHMILSQDGNYYPRQPDPLGTIYVVKKGAKHPEALLKMINVAAEIDNNRPNSPQLYADSPGTNWNVRPMQATYRLKTTLKDRFQRFQDTAAGKLKKADLPPADVSIFDNYSKGWDAIKSVPQDWAYTAYQFLGGQIVLDPRNKEVYSQFYGSTKTMELKWANLTKLENEAFVQIITGNKPLEYFDTFVSEWNKQGGDEITQEVRKAAKGSGT
ncbi:extracellular solute-binding protein [Paenibacillus sp. GCM10012303]|uniref:extracellular solute-binding protein n=1 Tax=Paenibacillus sp. GCM10012303 TaxID=3317340 RepID=UPI00360610DC